MCKEGGSSRKGKNKIEEGGEDPIRNGIKEKVDKRYGKNVGWVS